MEIEFIASLPDIQSAILISGEGATRVKLDIPESEIAEAIKLVMLKGMAFKVKISEEITAKTRHNCEEENPPQLAEKPQTLQKRAGRKSKRKAT